LKFTHYIVAFILVLFNVITSFSQKVTLNIYALDSIENNILKKIDKNNILYNFNAASNRLKLDSINNTLLDKGYLNYKIKLIEKKDTILNVCYELNKKSNSIHIKLPNDALLFEYIKYLNLKLIDNQVAISFNYAKKFLNGLVSFFEKEGYSFVKVKLKNIDFKLDELKAELILNYNKKRTIDKVIVKGYDNFPIKFLNKYYNFRTKNKFTKTTIDSIYNVINAIPFVIQLKKPQILFLKDATLIYIYLKKRKVNSLDGLIGFNNSKESNLKLNGSLDVNLLNIFNKGEALNLLWKSNDKNKVFRLNVDVPYVFKSNFSPNVDFSIFSQDSTYVDVKSISKLNYKLNYQNSLGVVFENKISIDLKDAVDNIEDYKSNLIGLNYTNLKRVTNNVFYKYKRKFAFNFLRGSIISNEISAKKAIVSFDGNLLIDLNAKNNIYIRNSSKYLTSETYYFNDLYLLGGLESLRGFKINSILANKYTITNIDYNFKVNNKAYVYSVFDYGLVKNNIINKTHSLFGLGIGYKTKLKSAILNINYVNGFSNENEVDLGSSIFNVSFISFF